jgi:ssDNA-binding Zn-finger/Zn-ribbon topoisomerase 1
MQDLVHVILIIIIGDNEMVDWIAGLVVIGIIILFIFGVWDPIGKKHEKERFNDGECPNCGIELKFYKQDNIHTWYRCPKCQYTAQVSINGNVDRRYCDIFDCWPHLHECQRECGADPKMCKHYHDKQKENKTKKIPPKKISEDSWPGMV